MNLCTLVGSPLACGMWRKFRKVGAKINNGEKCISVQSALLKNNQTRGE